jgi:hypothetical protein
MAKKGAKAGKSGHSIKRLQPLQIKAIGLICMGEKRAVVIEQLGVAPTTLRRWLKSPVFLAELDKEIQGTHEEAMRTIKARNNKAIDAAMDVIDDLLTNVDTPPNVKAQVAFKVLERVDKLMPTIEVIDNRPKVLDPEILESVTKAIYGI